MKIFPWMLLGVLLAGGGCATVDVGARGPWKKHVVDTNLAKPPSVEPTAVDVNAAVAAARRAFDETGWSTDAALRKRCLTQLIDALKEDRENLRSIVVHEAGSPLMLTYAVQCDMYIDAMPYWADLAESYPYESTLPDYEFMGQPQRRLVWKEAAGVVGAITPWNFPLYLNLCKLGPALAAGCTVVLKPSEIAPMSSMLFAEILLLACLGLFHSLTVRVDEEAVALRFGIGIIRRRFPIAAIESARAIRNPWYCGWGIRRIRNGWLFNVSGFDAVELGMADGRRYRIGTDEPDRLRHEILRRLPAGE